MKYNSNKVTNRSANHSSKYDEGVKRFEAADVTPLWVVNMDSRMAQPIIGACEKKAKGGI